MRTLCDDAEARSTFFFWISCAHGRSKMTIWVCDSPPDILLYSLPVVASTSNEAEPDAGQLNEPSRESSFATFSAHDPGTGLTSYDPPPALLPAHISQQHRSSSVEVYCYMKGLRHPVLEPLLDSSAIGLLSLSPLCVTFPFLLF